MSDPDALQKLIVLAQQTHDQTVLLRRMEAERYRLQDLANPRYADSRRLIRHGFKVYSQADEDGIIQEIFNRIGVTSRTFIEFGVESGIECNTVKLLTEGWSGLWIDGSDRHAAEIRRTFEPRLAAGQLKLHGAIVSAENINSLIAQAEIAGDIDLLSIDIDYNDYWVWKAIETVTPRVVVIEYNATLRPPMSLVVPYEPARKWDGTNYFGASLEALVRLGRDKGYRVVGCNYAGVNAFFVRDDVAGDHFLDPATAEEHYEPPRYFYAFQSAGHRARPGPYVSV
ncbi:MAG: hypothetical protein Q8M24_12845 [Pseudolabrys sp.]|nr:hypothetical protein [Pseudolabrys sp.]MDP2296336.1 hypothetical protein [Pseudolabrys sp.]